MVLAGQRVQPGRYSVIPRTLIFLVRGDQILLIKLGQDRAEWSGKLNGLGGHIEAGEDPLSSAQREVFEETGLEVSELYLAGLVLIDTGASPGIALYVFTGNAPEGGLNASIEGEPIWVSLDRFNDYPLVSDLPILIPAALESTKSQNPFFASTSFDSDGKPIIRFSHE
ncbi:MAG: NUDIX domain-containing protein [Anaerolineales bacterium]|jgi:8-oxo-dGTP diphosphatase